MNWILKNGWSFFLDTPIEILVQRLITEQDKRPLVKGKNAEVPAGYEANAIVAASATIKI